MRKLVYLVFLICGSANASELTDSQMDSVTAGLIQFNQITFQTVDYTAVSTATAIANGPAGTLLEVATLTSITQTDSGLQAISVSSSSASLP